MEIKYLDYVELNQRQQKQTRIVKINGVELLVEDDLRHDRKNVAVRIPFDVGPLPVGEIELQHLIDKYKNELVVVKDLGVY
jgi:hypothetical protein